MESWAFLQTMGLIQKSIYQERVMEMPQIENLINWDIRNRIKDDLESQSCMMARSLGHKSPPQMVMSFKRTQFWTCLKFIPRKMLQIQELGLYWVLLRARRTISHSSWTHKEEFKWKRPGWKTCKYNSKMPVPRRGLEAKFATAQGFRRLGALW